MTARDVWAIRIALFLDLLGFGMIIPDIQLRAEHMGAPGWLIGLLLALMFIVQMVASPRWGRWGDRTGHKRVVVLCTLISASAMTMYGLAQGLAWLFASRILAGLGGANVSSAQALISSAKSGPDRATELSRMSAAIQTGLVLGPSIGGMVSHQFGSSVVGFVAAGCSFAGAACLAGLRSPTSLASHPEHVEPDDSVNPHRTAPRSSNSSLQILRDFPAAGSMAALAAIAWLSLATLEGTFGRLLEHRWGYGAREFGWVFGYESLLGVFVSGVLAVAIFKRVKAVRVLPLAYAMQGLGLLATPFMPNLACLFVASSVYAPGSSLANPAINTTVSELVPEERHGELFGLMQSARSVGFVLGPLVGGALFDWQNAAPYVLAGSVCLVASVLSVRIRVPNASLAAP